MYAWTQRSLPLWAPAYRHVVFPHLRAAAAGRTSLAPGGPGSDAADDEPPFTADVEDFLGAVLRSGGLRLEDYRARALQRRVPACLRALKAASPREALRLLEHRPQLAPLALNALVIGVTSLFRDPPVFEFLRSGVVPGLGDGRKISVWCAGCSEGAEACSMAVLLAEAGLISRCRLLGTDCRPDAIRRAALGLFDASAVASVPRELLARHFLRRGGEWQVRPELMGRIRWRVANLLAQAEPGPWDVIFCRNVAMYLSGQVAASLWRNIEELLRPGGVLVLGKAERPGGARHLQPIGPCVYRRLSA